MRGITSVVIISFSTIACDGENYQTIELTRSANPSIELRIPDSFIGFIGVRQETKTRNLIVRFTETNSKCFARSESKIRRYLGVRISGSRAFHLRKSNGMKVGANLRTEISPKYSSANLLSVPRSVHRSDSALYFVAKKSSSIYPALISCPHSDGKVVDICEVVINGPRETLIQVFITSFVLQDWERITSCVLAEFNNWIVD